MEQIQADMAEMRDQITTQMNAQMTRFMEVITNVTKGQEELRALVEKTREEQGQHELLSDDFSAGQTLQNPIENPFGTDTPDHVYQHIVPPPPPPPRQPHIIIGNVQPRVIRKESPLSPELEVDCNEDMYSMHHRDIIVERDDRKLRLLEERLKVVEGQGALGMDLTDLGLVPGMKIPHKFKVPTFDKYTGLTCPKTHVRAYFRKMSAYSDDDKLLMHFFQDSLAGASLDWYMQLERTHIRSWRDLVEAFLRHYQYNIDMAPNRTQLQNLTQGTNESFKEYV